MRRLAFVLLALVACEKRQAPVDAGPPTAEQVAAMKREALAQVKPFQDRPEYLLSEPEIVDPCMEKALKGAREKVVQDAAYCIQYSILDPPGMALLEKKIADRYAHPVITLHGSVAKIDMAVVAGKLKKGFKHSIEIAESPNVEHYQWTTSEAVRAFKLAIERYPDAKTVRADVDLLSSIGWGIWHYVYDRRGDVIRVYDPSLRFGMGASITPKLGGNLEHVPSLYTMDLKVENGPQVPVPE